MPELAEVEHSRRIWDVGLGDRVTRVEVATNAAGRVLRDLDVAGLQRSLKGQPFHSSEARGKQLAFRFGGDGSRWLLIHLGMEGSLRVEGPTHAPHKHDMLVIRQAKRALVFRDLRHFGRVRFFETDGTPEAWAKLPPALDSKAFDAAAVGDFLARRKRSALKPTLLDQRRFPGVGNWMADEILWRARLAPQTTGGELSAKEIATLTRVTKEVARKAIAVVTHDWDYPKTWLFAHRWEDGGSCPRCGHALARAMLGGRRTCWCPTCQPRRASAFGSRSTPKKTL